MRCACAEPHACRLVVLTGGPGAGKTAVLEVVRRRFCEHVVVLPEAASIVFGGGFPRREGAVALRCAQRAIFHIQRELERIAIEEHVAAVALCDRGTIDGAAYWPDAGETFWTDLKVQREEEMARYAAVIHLRTPRGDQGYNRQNPVRTESANEAAARDARIADAWAGHPRRYFVDSADDFLEKLARAVALIREEVISDNYFCRLTTTTSAGGTPCGRPVRPWELRAPTRCWGSGSPDGHGQAGPLAEEEADARQDDGGRGERGRDEREDGEEVAAWAGALGDENAEGVAHAAGSVRRGVGGGSRAAASGRRGGQARGEDDFRGTLPAPAR
jgi:predicted ATPase